MTFGEKLKSMRRERGMKQEELAEILYVSRSAISKWETDRGYPSIDTLVRLAQVFGVSVDDLISEEDLQKTEQLQKKKDMRFYVLAAAFVLIAFAFALAAQLSGTALLMIGAFIGVIGHFICAVLFSSSDGSKDNRRNITRFIVLIILLTVIIGTSADMFA